MCNRVLCKTCQGTIRQEYPRATAQWRKQNDHAHASAFLHSSGPLCWLSPLVWRDLHLLIVSNSPEFKSFSPKMCAEAPKSIKKCLSSGFVQKDAIWFSPTGILHYQASTKEQNVSFDSFWGLQNILRQFSDVFSGAPLLSKGFVLRSFLEIGSARNSLLKLAFLNDSLSWTLHFHNFYVTHRGLCDFDSVSRVRSHFDSNRYRFFPEFTWYGTMTMGRTRASVTIRTVCGSMVYINNNQLASEFLQWLTGEDIQRRADTVTTSRQFQKSIRNILGRSFHSLGTALLAVQKASSPEACMDVQYCTRQVSPKSGRTSSSDPAAERRDARTSATLSDRNQITQNQI